MKCRLCGSEGNLDNRQICPECIERSEKWVVDFASGLIQERASIEARGFFEPSDDQFAKLMKEEGTWI